MIRRFFKRLFVADARLIRRVAELESELDAARRLLVVTETERDTMAAALARDRARVEAETAAYSRQRAEHEGTNDARPRVVT